MQKVKANVRTAAAELGTEWIKTSRKNVVATPQRKNIVMKVSSAEEVVNDMSNVNVSPHILF